MNNIAPPIPPTPPANPEYLIALYDFDARWDDEISIRKGDHILVLETDSGFEDGWYIVCQLFFNKTLLGTMHKCHFQTIDRQFISNKNFFNTLS